MTAGRAVRSLGAPGLYRWPFAGARIRFIFPGPSHSTLPFICSVEPSLLLSTSSHSPQRRQTQAKAKHAAASLLWVLPLASLQSLLPSFPRHLTKELGDS